MPLSRFEPLLLHKTSRAAGCRTLCRCSGRYKQLVWTPGSQQGGCTCTCPSWCVCRSSCVPRTAHWSNRDYCICGRLHRFCSCRLDTKPRSPPIKAKGISKSSGKTALPKICDCWRKIVGCCTCPAKDILYRCKPLEPWYTCCASCWCKFNWPKPCCCSGRGCILCCRRKAALIRDIRLNSWVDDKFLPSTDRAKQGVSSPHCSCLHQACFTLCLSTSQGEKLAYTGTSPSIGSARCICCTCKPGVSKSPSTLEDICVCPPWCPCKQRSPKMAESTPKLCPTCRFPLSGLEPPISGGTTRSSSKKDTDCADKATKISEADGFACPPWCTCKHEHSVMRNASAGSKELASGGNTAAKHSYSCLTLDPIDRSGDWDDRDIFRDIGNRTSADLDDSDSDDSFHACAWIRRPPLDLDDSDSDVLSIIDSDDDLVNTSDSDGDIDFECFGKPAIETSLSGILRVNPAVRIPCYRPTINVRL